jgi:hypothetical protein
MDDWTTQYLKIANVALRSKKQAWMGHASGVILFTAGG